MKFFLSEEDPESYTSLTDKELKKRVEDVTVNLSSVVIPSAPISACQVIKQFSVLIFSAGNRCSVGMATVLTFAGTGLNILSPYLFAETVAVLSTEDDTTTLVGIELTKQELIAVLVASYALSQIMSCLSNIIMARITTNNVKKLVMLSTEHLLQKSLNYHVHTSSGEQFYLIQKGFSMSTAGTALATKISPIIAQIFTASSLLWVQYGTPMGASLLALLVTYFGYSALTAKYIININEMSLKVNNEAYTSLIGTLERYKVMRDFCKYEHAVGELDAGLTAWAQVCTRQIRIPERIRFGYNMISYLHMLSIAVYVGSGIQSGKYNTKDFIAIVSYLLQLSTLLPSFGQSITEVFTAYPDLKFVFSELAKPKEIIDIHYNIPLELEDKVAPSIEFDGISFSYFNKPGEITAIALFNDLSFKVESGQRVALVSGSGEGKTTLFNLLYGYYIPTAGLIKINEQNISSVSLNSLQNSIGIFGQNPNLFQGSIRQNICYGAKYPETITDTMIMELANRANLSDFIENFPDKLNTEVGEKGKALSGGQQQKVAVLRGLIKESAIWLFDEVTANLDAKSASEILSAIEKVSTCSSKTILMITHKLMEARKADKIVVIDKGKVISEGTHDQLLENCEFYRKLWRDENHLDAQKVQSMTGTSDDYLPGGGYLNTLPSSKSIPDPVSSQSPTQKTEKYFFIE